MNLQFISLLIVYTFIITSFCLAIFKISKLKSNKRLIWHLIVCFFPVIGTIIFFASNDYKQSLND
ncbi:PLDc N-terminal domain-containing protein [Chryseobacterium salviniae]|uniref:PLDc N-terminal domain-containing protein n=1 Tax=Chryseobacterium salviniae TaxID=3101750 RepID=UPI00398C3AF2